VKIEKGHVYLADLNPQLGTEPGKVRPVVVVQTDLLNNIHPSTVVCPITTNVISEAELLRVHMTGKASGLKEDSDILVDQIRAIDNRRFIKHLGKLTSAQADRLWENLQTLILS
jgi:mRNA interferase MazF